MVIRWTDEAERGYPYWWHALEGQSPLNEALPEKCELLVIGAGYAGLSAALAAQNCGAQVVVVDADEPGQGASTRNGGMFGAHPRLGWHDLAARFGTATADALFAEAKPALDWARGLIAEQGIECDLQESGRVQLAWTASHFENQKRLAGQVRDKSEVQVRIVERDDLKQEIETDRYFGGLVFSEHCAIHPAKFHQGLLRAVRRKDIPVVAHARVDALERAGAGFEARTPKGVIRADKVLLATNGYTTKPFGWHAARVFPLPSYLIATEELPPNLIGHIAPGRRMMVETRARHSYYRISPDGRRILFGGRASMTNIDLATAAKRQHQTMCEIWPVLADVKLSHVWTGNTGYSFSHMPHVGSDRGLHYAMGFSGSGTVMAPYLGAKAAYQAMGDMRGKTAYSDTRFNRHWLHPFNKPHFLKAADLWYRGWVDRWENRQGR
ncbi:Gamma-glutamylputrescine oxidoreductase [Roseovarius litorisediminis]|uniref:Gamma-glutamylputrescine oxidoreductase n=1 Tax=Roseovarius litorisediminis TaxID=1312363 RepID=A0A1Y5SHA7_9RHOB|nr:FAD-binding oxidoreductase [Roseovarius litorisediminis]SLN37850.1 Gamma-glutamylputrescine oxidoreductase [Roseovarius litorisediminis]